MGGFATKLAYQKAFLLENKKNMWIFLIVKGAWNWVLSIASTCQSHKQQALLGLANSIKYRMKLVVIQLIKHQLTVN